MKNGFERLTKVILVLCAGMVAVSAVHSTYAGPSDTEALPPTYVPQWQRALAFGRFEAGNSRAPVTIVALVDLQCPACAAFHATLKQVMADHAQDVRVIYVHNPLDYHTFAMPAARAAECAADEGRFASWVDAVYAKRDSLGLRSWAAYAHDAGIRDTSRVLGCIKDSVSVPRIVDGLEFGSEIKITGTPTVLVNGWKFNQVPSRIQLDSAIQASLAHPSAPGKLARLLHRFG